MTLHRRWGDVVFTSCAWRELLRLELSVYYTFASQNHIKELFVWFVIVWMMDKLSGFQINCNYIIRGSLAKGIPTDITLKLLPAPTIFQIFGEIPSFIRVNEKIFLLHFMWSTPWLTSCYICIVSHVIDHAKCSKSIFLLTLMKEGIPPKSGKL